MRRTLESRHFSGSILVAARGRIELDRAYGRGLRPDTLYDIGSVAKLFTAAAVLALDETGRLRLDAPITRYLAHVPRADAEITVRGLLTHTSGLPANFSGDLVRLTRTQAVRRILSLPLHAPGRFAYSNAGYVLLAAIVGQTSGTTFERFVRRRLIEPARLHATGWYHGLRLSARSRAEGFVAGRPRGRAGARPLGWAILGAGGMLSTVRDLYDFVRALDSGRLLDRRHTRELHHGYARVPNLNGVEASIGGVVATTPGGRVYAVGGDTDFGFTADVRRFSPQQVTIVILANTDRAPAGAIGFAVARALRL